VQDQVGPSAVQASEAHQPEGAAPPSKRPRLSMEPTAETSSLPRVQPAPASAQPDHPVDTMERHESVAAPEQIQLDLPPMAEEAVAHVLVAPLTAVEATGVAPSRQPLGKAGDKQRKVRKILYFFWPYE
jgi:hypothetical protein